VLLNNPIYGEASATGTMSTVVSLPSTSFPIDSGVRILCAFSSSSYAEILETKVSSNLSTRPRRSPTCKPPDESLSSGYLHERQQSSTHMFVSWSEGYACCNFEGIVIYSTTGCRATIISAPPHTVYGPIVMQPVSLVAS
jgi:hypothetical protein